MPIKSRWIHEFLNILEVGDKNKEIQEKLDEILFEVAGKESRRKIRTILLRYFVDTRKINARTVEVVHFPLLKFAKCFELDTMKPLYLEVLLLKSESIGMMLDILLKRYRGSIFTRQDVRNIVIAQFGERRTTEKFVDYLIKLLLEFNVAKRIDTGKYTLVDEIDLNELQKLLFVSLLRHYGRINTIDTKTFSSLIPAFSVFNLDFSDVFSKYNGKLWDLSYRTNGYVVYVRPDIDKKILQLYPCSAKSTPSDRT